MRGVGIRWGLALLGLAVTVGACDDEGPLEATVGAVRVTATTSGDDPDPDGYTVALDGGAGLTLPASGGEVVFSNVAPGAAGVELTGVAANCAVDGDNPRSVTVVAGDTVSVDFTVACTALTSNLVVVTSTTGDSIDTDGYTARVGGDSLAVGVNDTVTFADVAPGDLDVTLDGVASNCSVTGGSTQTVTVPSGGDGTATFEVTCTAPATNVGTVVVTTASTGDSIDADGYLVRVGADSATAAVDDTLTFTSVPEGLTLVELSGVAPNCTVSPADTTTVTVTTGGTVQADFAIACTAPAPTFGTLVVSTSTSGDSLDADGYTVAVGSRTDSIGINDLITFDSVAVGTTLVELSGVAPNCSASADTLSVDVLEGDTAQAAFAVTCTVPVPVGPRDLIAFTTDRDGNDEVYLQDPDSAAGTNLTSDAGVDGQAAWSPDSTRIAFRSERDGNGEIYVVNADGTGLVNLTNDAGDDGAPAWSPDGTRIAFSTDRDGNTEVYVMDADGQNPTNLTNDAAADSAPSWSPDGTRIAFSTDRDGNTEVYVMDADGQNPANLTNDAGADGAPTWSPDGSQIAFSTDRDGNSEIYVMDADGTDPVNLTNDAGSDRHPSWGVLKP